MVETGVSTGFLGIVLCCVCDDHVHGLRASEVVRKKGRNEVSENFVVKVIACFGFPLLARWFSRRELLIGVIESERDRK